MEMESALTSPAEWATAQSSSWLTRAATGERRCCTISPTAAADAGSRATLALDKAGNLYGTASGGRGNCGYACGVIFRLSPPKNGKWKYTELYNLTPAGGGLQPFYGVIVDDKGNLFGVTSQFGKYGAGTAFEITP
jgi:hypothetical protein